MIKEKYPIQVSTPNKKPKKSNQNTDKTMRRKHVDSPVRGVRFCIYLDQNRGVLELINKKHGCLRLRRVTPPLVVVQFR